MADNVAIKLRFRQQVAAEALKNIPKRAKRVFFRIHRGAEDNTMTRSCLMTRPR